MTWGNRCLFVAWMPPPMRFGPWATLVRWRRTVVGVRLQIGPLGIRLHWR